MGTILVTGGAGFIGSALVQRLYKDGHKIIVLDSLSPQIHGTHPESTSATFSKIKGLAEFHQGDIRNRELLKKILVNVEIVVHLAAETGTGQSMYDISNYCDVNIQGTSILLEEIFAVSEKIRKIIVASSRAIYGEGRYFCKTDGDVFPDTRLEESLNAGLFQPRCPKCNSAIEVLPTTEESPAKPQSIYGITKFTQEQLVLKTARAQGISAVALRFQNVYGPGQSLSNPYTGILSIFSTRARENKDINVFEDGLESRDFVYIDDVVESLRLAVSLDKISQVALNVGSGQSVSVTTVVNSILNFFNSTSEVKVTGEYRIGDIRHNTAELKLAKAILGFEPRVQFAEGLKSFLTWVQNQGKSNDTYDQSLVELRERGLLK